MTKSDIFAVIRLAVFVAVAVAVAILFALDMRAIKRDQIERNNASVAACRERGGVPVFSMSGRLEDCK